MTSVKYQALEPSIPDWLPNWRDIDQYPNIKIASQRQWAWEFLRRNPEYQRQWRELIEPWINVTVNLIGEVPLGWIPVLPAIAGGKYGGFDNNAAMVAHKGRSPWKVINDQFSIHSPFLVPPSMLSSQSLEYVHFTNNVGAITLYGEPPHVDPLHEIELRPYEQIIVFNLESDIAPQITVAREALKHSQKRLKARGEIKVKKSRNSSPLHYQRYLRLLDGKTAGASYREMAKIFYPTTALEEADLKIRDALKAAERIRDTDYKLIPRPVK